MSSLLWLEGPLQSLVSCFLEPPVNRRVAGDTIEGLWRGYYSACPKGAVCWAPVAVTQAGGDSSVLSLLCARDQTNETVSTGQIFSKFSGGLWRGFLGTFFPLLFPSCPSALSRDSSPAKTNETQALMSHCKNSLRDKAIRGGFGRIQREATRQGVNHCRGQGLGPWC